MKFLTVREPKEGEHKILRNFGGRGFYGPFRFRAASDPMVERIAVEAVRAPDAMNFWAVEQFLPDITTGAQEGWEFSVKYGVRFCGVRVSIRDQKYHDVDTYPDGMRKEGFSFVTSTLKHYAEPVPPLRGEWLTSDVVALAKGIHANAALDGILPLTDALLEAGCDDPLVIEHLQTCTDHSPSCWVVEMILHQLAHPQM